MALGTVTVRIRADIAGLTSGLAQAQAAVRRTGASMNQLGQSMQSVGSQVTTAITLPLLAVGAAAARVAGDFQASMIRLQAISGATGNQLDQLRRKAEQMGAETKFSARDAADALNFMAMAGVNAANSLEALPYVLQLAAAAGMDMARATDIAMSIMAGYRLRIDDLAHANDVLVYAMNATNTSLESLGEAMKYAGPVAAAAGVQFEEAAAILGMMGNAGIQGSMAGTSLRGALSRLLAPTDQITAAMDAAGIALHRTSEGGVDLIDLMRQLEPRANDAGLMMTIFGQRAGPALSAVLSQGVDALELLTIQLELSEGTAADVANAYNEGLNGAVSSLQSGMEALALSIGRSGLTENLTNMANDLADLFRALADVNPKLLEAATLFAGVVAAIGPLIVIVGMLVRGFGLIFGALAGPVGLIAALVAVAVALPLWSQLQAEIRGVESATRDAAEPMERIAEINRDLATASGEAAAALRMQRFELTKTLLLQSQQAEAEAQRLETIARGDTSRPQIIQAIDRWEQGTFGVFGPTNQSRAQEARARANSLNSSYSSAFRANVDADTLPDRQRSYNEAMARYRAARSQPGFDTQAWAASNAEDYRTLTRAGADINNGVVRTGAVGGDMDLLDMTDMAGGAPATPTQRRAGEIATLQSLSGVQATSVAELDRLTAAQTAMNEAVAGGEELTSEEALAFVDLRDKLQGAIDKQREALQAEQARADASKEFMRGLEQEEAARQALTAAANQGTAAYERMLIIQGLLRDNPALSPDEAAAIADNIQRSTDALEAATSRMQGFQQMWDQIGQAVGSAFEKAILDGEKLGDVLKSLARDIAALVLRTLVTEPLANSISSFLSSAFGGSGSSGSRSGSSGGGGGWMNAIGSAVMSFFGGFFAEGGKVSPGKWGIAGERGPEPIFGGTTGLTVVPNTGGGGSMHVDARTYVNAPGADPAQLARVEARLAGLQRDLPNIIQGRVANMNSRGRGWAA